MIQTCPNILKWCEKYTISITVVWHQPPRQRSQIKCNRRIQWSQTPPNFNDYAPECLQSHALGPLQQAAPMPVEEGNPQKKSVKRGAETPEPVSRKKVAPAPSVQVANQGLVDKNKGV